MKLPRAVIVLSFVSFLNDLASDIVVPLIPILLATVLGAGPIVLGLVEGVADAVASFLKLWSGRRSDAMDGRRKPLAVIGYSISNVARPLLALATGWPMVVALRSLDRVGKGIRSAPRDAMISDCTPPEIRGYAFGFHRAFDNAGAVFGSLLAALVLYWSGMSLQEVILWSAVPGVLAVVLLAWGVKVPLKSHTGEPRKPLPKLRWGLLSPLTRRYLLVLALFTFARASETFILLRGNEMHIGVVLLLILWAAIAATKSTTALFGGWLADRIGRAPVMVTGWVVFGISFFLIGQAAAPLTLVVTSLIFGLAMGFSEGAERAIISELAGPREQGTAFGWYHLMVGFAAIPAGLLFGGVWHWYGAAYAFGVAGGLALLSAGLLHFWVGLTRPSVAN